MEKWILSCNHIHTLWLWILAGGIREHSSVHNNITPLSLAAWNNHFPIYIPRDTPPPPIISTVRIRVIRLSQCWRCGTLSAQLLKWHVNPVEPTTCSSWLVTTAPHKPEGRLYQQFKMAETSPFKGFIAGGVGGVCIVLTGHPLDTMKVLLYMYQCF